MPASENLKAKLTILGFKEIPLVNERSNGESRVFAKHGLIRIIPRSDNYKIIFLTPKNTISFIFEKCDITEDDLIEIISLYTKNQKQEKYHALNKKSYTKQEILFYLATDGCLSPRRTNF